MAILLSNPIDILSQAQPLTFQFFGVNDGLSQGNVTCIFQDHLGLMWFGTWDGLNIYDGFQNTIYRERANDSNSLKGSLVNTVHEISNQHMVIGTSTGLNFFDRKSRLFSYYSIDKQAHDTRVIQSDSNKLIVSIGDKLYTFDVRHKLFYPLQNRSSQLWNTYFSNSKKAVNHSAGLYTQLYMLLNRQNVEELSLKLFLEEEVINDIYFSNDGFYLATDNGLWQFQQQDQSLKQIFKDCKIKSLAVSGERLYIGTQHVGLWVFNLVQKKLEIKYQADDRFRNTISGNFIRTLYIDHRNTLWASSLGSGINYTSLQPKIATTIFSKSDARLVYRQDNYIKTLAEDKDSMLWVSTVAGTIYLLDNHYQVKHVLTPNQIHPQFQPTSFQQQIITSRNQNYILSEKGIFRRNEHAVFERANTSNLNFNQQYLNGMSRHTDTSFLVATRDGICRFEEYSFRLIEEPDLPRNQVYLSTYVDQSNHLYVNPMFAGLDIYAFKNGKYVKLKTLPFGGNVKQYLEHGDSLILATTKGILIVNKTTFNYDIIDEEAGLPNQYIYCLLPDAAESNTFWCSSNKGIFQYNMRIKKVYALGLQDGLSSLEFNTNAFVRRKNGDLVFGSIDGLTYFNPNKLVHASTSQSLTVMNLLFEDQIPAVDIIQLNDSMYRVPYEMNTMSFRLMSVQFPQSQVAMQYKLEGLDKDWISGFNPMNIRYPDLHEGKYVLNSRVYDREKGWIDQTLLRLTILPPWYRTWWAYVMYVFGSVGLILGLSISYYRYKLKQKQDIWRRHQAVLEERNRISADLHDDIGSTLSSMFLFSDMAQSRWESHPEQSKDMVRRIKAQSSELISNMSDIIWSMKTSGTEQHSLKTRLLQMKADLLNPAGIDLKVDFDADIEQLIQQPLFRKNVLLILKEALNNVSKYSGADTVSIHFYQLDMELVLDIVDNGRGFSNDVMHSGNGLQNMRNRMKQLGGECVIQSEEGKGCTIRCRIPIANSSYFQTKK